MKKNPQSKTTQDQSIDAEKIIFHSKNLHLYKEFATFPNVGVSS